MGAKYHNMFDMVKFRVRAAYACDNTSYPTAGSVFAYNYHFLDKI